MLCKYLRVKRSTTASIINQFHGDFFVRKFNFLRTEKTFVYMFQWNACGKFPIRMLFARSLLAFVLRQLEQHWHYTSVMAKLAWYSPNITQYKNYRGKILAKRFSRFYIFFFERGESIKKKFSFSAEQNTHVSICWLIEARRARLSRSFSDFSNNLQAEFYGKSKLNGYPQSLYLRSSLCCEGMCEWKTALITNLAKRFIHFPSWMLATFVSAPATTAFRSCTELSFGKRIDLILQTDWSYFPQTGQPT